MDWLHLLLLGGIGVIGGILSGLVGVGGGIIFVPGLTLAGGWNIKEAVAASLIIIIFSSLSGTIRNAHSENPARWREAGLLSLTVAPASLIGVYISHISPEQVVEICFAALLLLLAYPTSRKRPGLGGDRKIPLPLALTIGALIGVLSGLVGVGGGVVLVPLLSLGFGLDIKTAISTSLVVVMAAALVGGAGYVATGFGNLLSLPPLIVGSMIGAWIGVRIRDPLPEGVIRTGFAFLMVLTALKILSDTLNVF